MKHVISILMEDRIGTLARIVELFSSRGYNVDSICSGEAERVGAHRLTLVIQGDDRKIGHITRLLNNLVNVWDVSHLHLSESMTRELMMAKVKFSHENRSTILQLINANQGAVIEMNKETISFEVVGSASQLDGITQIFREFELIELSRTGEAAIHR
ncbi:MAG: acetolactate synthase small subunit [SAR324 cluster bacterium]|uniref:Acetolactate synthase small subunit n=1 Tax=SAR324 cluster bacterium TaxID=2024889 RepID=A0A2A4T782_9DELT|nr:MAG: acetolactate synthase small subunit [SAR324 cluster bacterium]